MKGTYNRDPVPEMCVVPVLRNKIRGDRYDDNGRDLVQGIVSKDKGTVNLARVSERSIVIVRSVSTSHYFPMVFEVL